MNQTPRDRFEGRIGAYPGFTRELSKEELADIATTQIPTPREIKEKMLKTYFGLRRVAEEADLVDDIKEMIDDTISLAIETERGSLREKIDKLPTYSISEEYLDVGADSVKKSDVLALLTN